VLLMFHAMRPTGDQLSHASAMYGSLYGAWQHTHLNPCCPVCMVVVGSQPRKLRNQTAVTGVINTSASA
jgi:hypothetical protein